LGQHWLEHGKDRLGCFGGSGIADQIGKFLATRIDGAHVPTKIVHQNLRRIRRTAKLLSGLVIIALTYVIFFIHHVQEPLHDADVVDGHFFYLHVFCHSYLLKNA